MRISDWSSDVCSSDLAVGIDTQLLTVLQHTKDRIDATQIFIERCAADLFLDYRIAAIDIAAHFVFKLAVVLTRVIISASSVYKYFPVGLAIAIAVGQ